MKQKIKYFLTLLLLVLVWYVLSPRSMEDMRAIAELELVNSYDSTIVSQLEGPLLEKGEHVVYFTWYKALDWGDTAKISIGVYPNLFFGPSYNSTWQNFASYFQPSVSMSEQMYYLFFSDGLENNLPASLIDSSKIEIVSNAIWLGNDTYEARTVQYKYSFPQILRFISQGHYIVRSEREDGVLIEFYHPIGVLEERPDKKPGSIWSAWLVQRDSSTVIFYPSPNWSTGPSE